MRTVNVYAAPIAGKFGQSTENFGDNLMHFMLPEIFGVDVKYVGHSQADLIGIGSIIDAYWRKRRKPYFWQRRPWRELAVWGSGFMSSDSADEWPQRLRYHAVRGPLSAARVPNGGALALGDPAILLPKIWAGPKQKTCEVLVIPHFATHQKFTSTFENDLPKDWKILDLRSDPKDVCEQIAGSEFVVTSSLHGLIVSDAYGVPSCRIFPTGKIKGDGFKFKDYEAQRGKKFSGPFLFQNVLAGEIDMHSPEFTPAVPSDEVLERLIASFPFR